MAGVTSARGANSGSAEALAPAVAVICGGGPITRVELPEHAVAPAALVDAVSPPWASRNRRRREGTRA